MAELTHAGRIGYASGNLGKSVLWATLDYFFLFFLTDLWGLGPAQAGLIILIALVFDGLAAPVMGFIADRSTFRHGKYGPYLAIGAPLCALSFALLLRRPPVESEALFWWVLAASLIFRACYTICDVPHNALFARVFHGPQDARLISGMRFFFSSLGAVLVAIGAGWVLANLDAAVRGERLAFFGAAAGLTYVATLWWSWWATAAVDRSLPNYSAGVPLEQALKTTLTSPGLGLVFLIAFVQAASLPLFAKLLAYFATYVAQDPSWVGRALLILTLAQAASMPVWVYATRRISSSGALLSAYAVSGFGLVAFGVTSNGVNASSYASLMIVGAGLGGANMALWALLPEAIARGGAAGLAKAEALPTGIFLLAIKCGIGLGAGGLGLALEFSGLGDAQRDPQAFSDFLVVAMVLAPCVGLTFAGAMTWRGMRRSEAF